MRYWFYALSCIGIYVYLGFGLTLFLLPSRLRGYLLFWAPFLGYCYLTLVGWFLYNLDIGGTDRYAIYMLIRPGSCFARRSGRRALADWAAGPGGAPS